MNTIMIDGTGMCGGCRLTVNGETKFACVDGPDFDGHLVDFDEAIMRSRMYKAEEKLSDEKHFCHLIGGERYAEYDFAEDPCPGAGAQYPQQEL